MFELEVLKLDDTRIWWKVSSFKHYDLLGLYMWLPMSCLNLFVYFSCQIYKLSGNMHVYVLAKKLSTLVKNVVREIMSLNFLREKCQLVYSINDFTEFSHRSPLSVERNVKIAAYQFFPTEYHIWQMSSSFQMPMESIWNRS